MPRVAALALAIAIQSVLSGATCNPGGYLDGGSADATAPDAAALDSQVPDAASADAATADAAIADAAIADAAIADAASGDSAGTDAAASDAAGCVAADTVTVRDFRFDPACIIVSAGATVTWTNVGMASHTATSDPGAPVFFDSGPLGVSGSYSFQFVSTGTVGYHCTPHQASGMVGTVIVQ